MWSRLEGERELDGGYLSALSEAYLTTHPAGMFIVVHLDGLLDLKRWRRALDRIQRNYPIVRSRLREVKKILTHRLTWEPQPEAPTWEILDLEAEFSLKALLQHLQRPFDLFREPPWRFTLLRKSDQEFALVVNSHHAASDGVTQLQLLRDLIQEDSGEPKALGDIRLTLLSEENKTTTRPGPRPWSPVMGLARELWERRRHRLVRRQSKPSLSEFRPKIHSFVLNEDATRDLLQRAKGLKVSVNDLLNAAIIESLDEVRQGEDGMISACIPVNLRPYVSRTGRFANLTSGVYVNVLPGNRRNGEDVLQHFVTKRRALIEEGRAVLNLRLLQQVFRIFRLMPHGRRLSWLQRRGKFSATYLCSNLGRADLTDLKSPTGPDEEPKFRIRDWDLVIFPNRNVDYSIFSLTFRERLKIFVSTDEGHVAPEESDRFTQCFEKRLSLGIKGHAN